MDIAGVSMAMANIELSGKVGTAVLDKTMETSEKMGEGLIEMMNSAAMELSVNPAVGGNFDMRV